MTKFDLYEKVLKIILSHNTMSGLGCEFECKEPRYCQCENCFFTSEDIVDSLFNEDLTLKDIN